MYNIFQNIFCSPYRYALESITKGFFDAKSDVWSYGVTLWEMFMLWDEDQKDHVKPYDGLNEQEVNLFILYLLLSPDSYRKTKS